MKFITGFDDILTIKSILCMLVIHVFSYKAKYVMDIIIGLLTHIDK